MIISKYNASFSHSTHKLAHSPNYMSYVTSICSKQQTHNWELKQLPSWKNYATSHKTMEISLVLNEKL